MCIFQSPTDFLAGSPGRSAVPTTIKPGIGEMAGEKVTRILRAKSPFTKDEIAGMTDAQGWDWIYANAKPKKEKLSQVCFTGFSVKEKEELIELAKNSNLEVVGSVTKNLAFLCCGENAGPAKIQSARDKDCIVLTSDQFLLLIETGELPSTV